MTNCFIPVPPQYCANLCLHEEKNNNRILQDLVRCPDIVYIQLHRDGFIWIFDIWFRCQTGYLGVVQAYTRCVSGCDWLSSQDVYNISNINVCRQVSKCNYLKLLIFRLSEYIIQLPVRGFPNISIVMYFSV